MDSTNINNTLQLPLKMVPRWKLGGRYVLTSIIVGSLFEVSIAAQLKVSSSCRFIAQVLPGDPTSDCRRSFVACPRIGCWCHYCRPRCIVIPILHSEYTTDYFQVIMQCCCDTYVLLLTMSRMFWHHHLTAYLLIIIACTIYLPSVLVHAYFQGKFYSSSTI